MDWIQWVFSGVGVTIISGIMGWLYKKNKGNSQYQKSGHHSKSYQIGQLTINNSNPKVETKESPNLLIEQYRNDIMENLSSEEINILKIYYKNKKKILRFPDSPIMQKLANDDILYHIPEKMSPFNESTVLLFGISFSLTNWAWKYINKHPKKFK